MKQPLTLSGITDWIREVLDASGPAEDAIIAGLILVLGFLCATLGQRMGRRLALRISRWLARWSRREASASEAESFANGVGRTIYWLIVVFAVMAATESANLPVVTAWLSKVASFLPRIAIAIVIVALGHIAARVAQHVVTAAATSASFPAAARLGRLTQVALLACTWLVAVEQVGIEISFLKWSLLVVLAALLGGAALAFGLGSRQLVSNILAAHFLQKLYHVGQILRVDGAEGRITKITETAVILESVDGEVIIPARQLAETRSTLVTRGHSTP